MKIIFQNRNNQNLWVKVKNEKVAAVIIKALFKAGYAVGTSKE